MSEGWSFMCERSRSLLLGGGLLLVMLGVTALVGSRIREVAVASASASDVTQELPEIIGNWKGQSIYYCQKDQCARAFTAGELDGARICPLCEGALDLISLGERTILPRDTVIARRVYQNGQGGEMTVTIVLSGAEQRSIHRPQQCLPAQGYAVEKSSLFTVQLESGALLKLALISARREAATNMGPAPRMLMAYWFAGGGHETHDHFQRMAYMAWDNLIHGIRPRWAYVSLQTSAHSGDKLAEQRLADFVRQLYPLLKPESSGAQ